MFLSPSLKLAGQQTNSGTNRRVAIAQKEPDTKTRQVQRVYFSNEMKVSLKKKREGLKREDWLLIYLSNLMNFGAFDCVQKSWHKLNISFI